MTGYNSTFQLLLICFVYKLIHILFPATVDHFTTGHSECVVNSMGKRHNECRNTNMLSTLNTIPNKVHRHRLFSF